MSNTGEGSDNTSNKSNNDDKAIVEQQQQQQQQQRETVNQVLSQIINDISTSASTTNTNTQNSEVIGSSEGADVCETDILNMAAADDNEDDDDEDLTLLKDVKVSSELSKVDPTFTVNDTVKPRIQEPVQDKAIKRDTTSDDVVDDDTGAFGLLSKQKKRKKRKKNKPTTSLSIFDTTSKEPLPKHVSKVSSVVDRIVESSSHLEEDHLLFYSEDDNALHSARLKCGLQVALSNLKEEKEEDFQQIDAYASAKFQQRSDSLNRQINKVRVEMLAKQTRQRNQLEDRHKRKAENDRRKMKEGHELLVNRQQEESERRREQNNGPQWKQLKNRHDFQIKQFEESKIEMINRTQQEHNASFRILENHHQKRQIEGETYIQNLVNTAKLLQDKMIAKLSKLHQDRYAQREGEIRAKFSELDSMDEDAPCTNKGELQNMVVSSNPHDAVIRQEKRKAEVEKEVVQLAVEIHNEGIIAISRSNENEPLTCFIPWGHKARSILYSVTVMGQIPRHLENLKLSGSALVKCLITDSRVSEDTAACERSDSFARNQDVGIEVLESRYNDAQRAISTLQGECSLLIEKEDKLKVAHHEAVLELQKSDEGMNKIKARVFDEKNGTLSSNIDSDNKQRMITAVKMNEELKKKEKSLRQPLELLARKRVELHQMVSNAMALDMAIKNKRADHTSTDDKETIEKTIQRVHATVFDCAEKRRAQVMKNKKRSKWIKSAKELSMSEEKMIGIHQIMQQKRISTTLRPSVDTLLEELKDISGKTRKYSSDCFDIVNNNDDSLSPGLRAEQLLYLALHPTPHDNTKPTEKVEPGWQLILDNPCNDYSSNPNSILPTDNEGVILQQLSSSAASTDRSVASFIKPHHMRILGEEAPQAACALGQNQSNLFGRKKTTQDTIDPMSMTDESLGYNFAVGPFIREEEPKSDIQKKEESKSYSKDTGKEEPCLPVPPIDQEPCLPYH